MPNDNSEIEVWARDASKGNTPEPTLNVFLAELLRRHGLEAEAEQSLSTPNGRHQVDVLVELGDHAIAIESEFHPASTVLDDAKKRLPEQRLVWRGLAIDRVIVVVYPADLREKPESKAKVALSESSKLRFAIVHRRPASNNVGSGRTSPETFDRGSWRQGSVSTLAGYLLNYWIRTEKHGSVEDAVTVASHAIEDASEILKRAHSPHPLSAHDNDPEATSALIWLNALLIQELLATNLDPNTLPVRHRSKRIPRPERSGSPSALMAQWEEILEINWWPIFWFASQALKPAPPQLAKLALEGLAVAAAKISETGAARKHDIAGRIFHRLLGSRKFLATNYTTVPAAVILAGLAFDPEHPLWKERDWAAVDTYRNLRIVDPACGSGTLLMAALQEVLNFQRRFGDTAKGRGPATRAVLQEALFGYDVVPAAVHLSAATLSMAETSQLIANMPLFWMPHDVKGGKVRMGSLDFLWRSPSQGAAQHLPLFPDKGRDAERITGTGEQVHDADMPSKCDLMIANPPYTRAGGPGTSKNSDWNPVFGSVLSKADKQLMTTTLRRMLDTTPASLYAGLGSAFVLLARERVRTGGRLAFVLPATALTGSRWAPIRKAILEDFELDWVVVSHDRRSRSKRQNLPGRRFVAFSESTRIAEVLIVATKKTSNRSTTRGVTHFVNLRENPDSPIDAIAISRALLSLSRRGSTSQEAELLIGGKAWGEVLFVNQTDLDERPWAHSAFMQGRVVRTALEISRKGKCNLGGTTVPIPTVPLSRVCTLGPYHMQVKNPKQGLFDATSTGDPTRAGHPALWRHSAQKVLTLEATANARLVERADSDQDAQSKMLSRAARLQLASELGHAPQRLAAVLTDEPMIGFSSWITLLPINPALGKEEALCLWLNSTLGLLLRIFHANRPYLGRSRLPHELARDLPVIDIDSLSNIQGRTAKRIFDGMKQSELRGFSELATDPVRRELDHRFLGEVLGLDANSAIDRLASFLNLEPTLTARA